MDPNNPTGGEPEEPSTPTNQAPEGTPPVAAEAVQPTQQPKPVNDDDQSLKDYIKSLRDESKTRRLENEQLTKEKDELAAKQQELTDLVNSLKAEREAEKFANALEKAASAHKVVDAELLALLVEKRSSDIEKDEKGNPTNLDDIVKEIVEAKPVLKEADKPAPTSGDPALPARDKRQALTPQSAEAMSMEDFRKLDPKEVDKMLKAAQANHNE